VTTPGSPAGAVLGIDVGGTSVKARLVEADDTVVGEWREATPAGDADAAQTVALIADLVGRARLLARVDAVGLAIPGIVDETTGTSVHAVNLGWHSLPVRDLVAAAIALPLGFGQDVRVGALAESTSGAAAGVAGTVAFVPVGTGLAAAIVVDGVALVAGGWAGETGQVVIAQGPHAGRRVEEIASAGAIARRLGVPNARRAADLVRDGDPVASVVWREAVDVLADSLVWMTAVAAPGVIVVGGGLAEAGALLFEPLNAAVDARIGVMRRPAIVPALHGEAAAVIGATYLARGVLA
jgi:glucokinase